MPMSCKHYREVADIIRGADNEHFDTECSAHYVQGWLTSYFASAMASMFKMDNPNFDRDKFMEACFPPAGE